MGGLTQFLVLIENCVEEFFRRKRNDGNVMGTADYVRKENLFTGTETFKGQSKRNPDRFRSRKSGNGRIMEE